jgi:hypothetical protein
MTPQPSSSVKDTGKNIDLTNIISDLKRRYAAIMKLKNIYACVASAHPPCDDPYEATTKKNIDGERKSKKASFRPKWQPVSKSPKSRGKQARGNNNTHGLTLAITQGKDASEELKPAHSPSRTSPKSLLDQTPLTGSLPSPLKPSNPQDNMFTASTASWMSFDDENTFTSVFQDKSYPHYDQVADDETDNNSDNVVSVSSLEWNTDNNNGDNNKWGETHAAFQSTEVEKESIRAITALKLQSKYESAAAKRDPVDTSVFEDLKNEAMIKYGFCGFSSATTTTTKPSDPTQVCRYRVIATTGFQ